jgi:hypothetical protein
MAHLVITHSTVHPRYLATTFQACVQPVIFYGEHRAFLVYGVSADALRANQHIIGVAQGKAAERDAKMSIVRTAITRAVSNKGA